MRSSSTLPISSRQISCTDQSLIEMDSGKPLIVIPRNEITGIKFRHGFVSPHPVLQFLVGIALLAPGYFPTIHLIHWIQHGGPFFSLEVWIYSLCFIGLYTAISVFRRGYVLEIARTNSQTRLAFGRHVIATELEAFLSQLETQLGMKIDQA
ncbi:MAG TPA: hypothetical protein VIM11_08270 [Tepidisphaeraceae bacterium]|jgi:hypothetical protein